VSKRFISCPLGDRNVAHQIINSGNVELKYLALSTEEPHEICEYPDSNKVMCKVGSYGKSQFRHISKLDEKVDYFEGECD
jgi:uncharacterized cupin superfamily protein